MQPIFTQGIIFVDIVQVAELNIQISTKRYFKYFVQWLETKSINLYIHWKCHLSEKREIPCPQKQLILQLKIIQIYFQSVCTYIHFIVDHYLYWIWVFNIKKRKKIDTDHLIFLHLKTILCAQTICTLEEYTRGNMVLMLTLRNKKLKSILVFVDQWNINS